MIIYAWKQIEGIKENILEQKTSQHEREKLYLQESLGVLYVKKAPINDLREPNKKYSSVLC